MALIVISLHCVALLVIPKILDCCISSSLSYLCHSDMDLETSVNVVYILFKVKVCNTKKNEQRERDGKSGKYVTHWI